MMRVIDSHTEGEPTRLIIEGGPDLGQGPLVERRKRFAQSFDVYRRTAILEPRGSDILVGALLCEPEDSTCVAGVVFFNNVGYLGMCGHGTIGVAVSLAYQGRMSLGIHRLETPVGVVSVELRSPNEVTVENVPSYRFYEALSLVVPEMGTVTGDLAWGGNWFFLVADAPCELKLTNAKRLTEAAQRIKDALRNQGITGDDGGEIDHVEFFGPPESSGADSRNFVLCPGNAYDRSPCGTGTSAKLACLAASGKLRPENSWIQESISGGRFEGSYRLDESGRVIPRITGRAYVYSEATLLQHPDDPFREGIA
ncbi:MAG: 4-hydroxyproline 2-epimerase [Verrucomicrobia subdivision 3 bacterium]|nr:4-hydroxyproline 2-epimerase [Limisphaerales bacterium]MCS1412646.1 4-hydroxyproline 2-epimerase [Limisphaerales bacterium]